ncbi:MAG: PhzF family phenazine biosynthesis protein, partial [Rhizobiaceae bacterium]|nr:PhzF family phenazine biosynthesis protein [Rhizobiaceae bacterium]
ALRLAAEFNQPIMTLLCPRAEDCAVHFYTSEDEVGLVGHAALAGAFVALDRLYPHRDSIVLRSPVGGDLPVSREGTQFFLDLQAMEPVPAERIAHLDETLRDVAVEERLETPFGAVAVLEDEDAVRTLRPDLSKALEVEASTVIVTAPGRDVDFVSRVFAPKFDMPEDPVCGTAHRLLAPYWAARLGRKRLSARQLCDRGGRFDCHVAGSTVRLGGNAVLLCEADIVLPASS